MDVDRLLEIDRAYLQMAHVWAQLSRARRRKVGCIVVKDKMIISDGYNGTPSGFDNNCEYETRFGLETRDDVLHAESNAIAKLAKSTQSSVGADMYLTLSPCINCAKLIIQAEIKRVVYDEQYTCMEGVNLLKKACLKVVHIPL
jgi:dCMP deaminase